MTKTCHNSPSVCNGLCALMCVCVHRGKFNECISVWSLQESSCWHACSGKLRFNIVPNDSLLRIPHVMNTSNRTGSHSSSDKPDYCTLQKCLIYMEWWRGLSVPFPFSSLIYECWLSCTQFHSWVTSPPDDLIPVQLLKVKNFSLCWEKYIVLQ